MLRAIYLCYRAKKGLVRASGRLGRGPTQECRKENYAWYTRRLIHSIGVYPVYGYRTVRKVTLHNSYTLPMWWHTLRF
jgi:hypothetical protein